MKSTINTEKLIPIFQEYGIERAGIFGSYARGEERIDSDVDILVLPSRGMGLFRFTRLEKELSSTLGKKVDLVSERGLKERFINNVMADVRYIYERER